MSMSSLRLHQAPDRHDAARAGDPAHRWHRGVPAAAGGAAAAGRLPDHPGVGQPARGEPRDDGVERGAAAGAPVLAHRRPVADDLDERHRLDPDHLAVRPEPVIDGAALDVQAAIQAATGQLPANLPSPPTYRKVNPADSPIMLLTVQSQTLPLTEVNDFADNILAQQISQISGVGQVNIGGVQKPAVRIQVDPAKLAARRHGLEDVRGAIANLSVNQPKGTIDGTRQSFTVYTNDQLLSAAPWNDVVLAYSNGAPCACATSASRSTRPRTTRSPPGPTRVPRTGRQHDQNGRGDRARHLQAAGRQRHRDRRPDQGRAAALKAAIPPTVDVNT
jgi:hypothetical protein